MPRRSCFVQVASAERVKYSVTKATISVLRYRGELSSSKSHRGVGILDASAGIDLNFDDDAHMFSHERLRNLRKFNAFGKGISLLQSGHPE